MFQRNRSGAVWLLLFMIAPLLAACGGGGADTGPIITPTGVLSLLAGNDVGAGNTDGTGTMAKFNAPSGVATDNAGNIYVADTYNSTIRKITPLGVVTTLAGTAGATGSADGTGAGARFYNPSGVATDIVGNVYVADTYNSTIRKITSAGVVITLAGAAGVRGSADSIGAAANFSWPGGVATDSSTGNIYVADTYNHTIRKIALGGIVTTLAGTAGVRGSADGTGGAASFFLPQSVAIDNAGNIYVADSGNKTIRLITPSGVVTTLAGTAGVTGSTDGSGAAASFNSPQGIALDSAGNVYVADNWNSTIRKITPAGVVTTVVGKVNSTGFLPGQLPGSLSNPASVAIYRTTLYATSNNTVVQVTNVP